MKILDNLTSELENIHETLSDDKILCKSVEVALDFINSNPDAADDIARAFANMLDNAKRGGNVDLIDGAVENNYLNLREVDETEAAEFYDAMASTVILDREMLGVG